MKHISAFLFLIFSLSAISAQNLASWDFAGNTGSETTVTAGSYATGISSTLPSGLISRGTDLTASNNGNRFNATSWSTSATADLSGNDYMFFTIDPDLGYSMTLTSIDFNWQKSNTGPSDLVFTSSLDGHTSVIGTAFTGLSNSNTGLSLALPSASFSGLTSAVTFRVYGYNASSTAGSGGFEGSGNDLSIQGTAVNTAATVSVSSVSPEVYCLAGGSPVAVSVPYTVTGTFFVNNVFRAELSDANGDFSGAVNIGQLSSTTSGTISANIPASVFPGSGYRIRVVATNPSYTGPDNGIDLEVDNSIPSASNLATAPGNTEITLSWDQPATCADHVVVLVSEGSAVDASVSQANLDGLVDFADFSANSAWDLRSDANDIFDISANLLGVDNKDYVALADDAMTDQVTITGLTNGTTYHFRVFFLYNVNEYGAGADISAVPQNFCDKRLLITEYVEGNSFDKCIEIYNADDETINLGNYQIDVYSNGSTSAATEIDLDPVDLLPGDTYVLCNGSAGASFLAAADQTSILNHNGDDVIAINCPIDDSNLDVFGKIGQDPGSGWQGSTSLCNTANEIWRRNPFLGSSLTGTEATFDPDQLYLCVGSITDVSDLGNFGASFPVELLDFSGSIFGDQIILSWMSTVEVGNERYILEKATSTTEYQVLSELPGAGYSEEAISYSHTDVSPENGLNRYRLSQMDFDGTRNYLGEIELSFEKDSPISVFPNPATSMISVSFVPFKEQSVEVSVLSLDGKELMAQSYMLTPGNKSVSLAAEELAHGMYLLRVKLDGRTNTTTFIKR